MHYLLIKAGTRANPGTVVAESTNLRAALRLLRLLNRLEPASHELAFSRRTCV